MQSSIGVKQGCPLSPTLFGLLLDGLHFTLAEQCSWAGPWLNSQLATGSLDILQDLGYADDFCLLANSPSELQKMLDVAHGYLTSIGMEISVEKTSVMVFGTVPRRAAGHVWTCGGAALTEVQEYKYLGLLYTRKHGIAGTFGKLKRSMLESSFKLWAKFGDLHCGTSQKLQYDLFLESVPHAASYGSEVWGVLHLRGAMRGERADLARRYLRCVRSLVRLGPSVSEEVVVRELGVDTLHTLWLTAAARYWNTLVMSPAHMIRKKVLFSEVIDAQRLNDCNNWATSLAKALGDVGMALRLAWNELECVDMPELSARLAERRRAKWAGVDVCPRTCPSEGAAMVKYAQWFAQPEGDTRKGYLALNLGLKRTRMVLRFRMGAMYSLPVYNRDIPDRQARLCQCCDSGALGDERHLLFECAALQSVRDRHAHLFATPRTARNYMWQDSLHDVACFIYDCIKFHKGIIVGRSSA